MAAAKPAKTLDQVLARYRTLSDAETLKKVFAQVESYVVPCKAGKPLQKETLREYKSCMKLLDAALHDPDVAGCPRNGLPSLAELLLRPHGPRMVSNLLRAPSERRKVCTVGASLVARAFPELSEDARQVAQQAWQAQLREARRDFEVQRRQTGYGGFADPESLPSMREIEDVISKMPPCEDRLILRLYSECRFKAPYSTSAPLLNPGYVQVYKASEKHNFPTLQQMAAWAQDESQPRGWLLLDAKDHRRDQLFLVLGYDAAGETAVTQQVRMPPTLSQEIRVHLSNRPVGAQKYLLTSQKYTVDLVGAKPYSDPKQGRISFNARVNRLLMDKLECRLREFRVAVALAHQEQARTAALAEEGEQGE
jgi:hypothetical protein